MKLVEALTLTAKNPPATAAERFDVALVCGFTPLHLQTFLTAHLRRGYEIRRDDAVIGHFLLTHVSGQARVTDIRVAADSDWQAAYRLATTTTAADAETCEVVCIASSPAQRAALLACGFRLRNRLPLYIADPKGALKDAPPVIWSLIDNDLAYIYDAANPFLT